MRLFFCTTNANKVPSVAKALSPFGVQVEQYQLDIPELQAESASAVAREKAKWAFAQVGEPVIVVDSAFHIAALNGFPGTNVKWVTKQIGLEGYLRLMSPNLSDIGRSCYFEDALACAAAAHDEPAVFVRQVLGRLATVIAGGDRSEAKSALWRLFIPAGCGQTLAEMTAEELERHRSMVRDFYRDFALWFTSR
jgi:non-canonical purine NTP pyrophosphatase (RdgB/HAM1 family)